MLRVNKIFITLFLLLISCAETKIGFIKEIQLKNEKNLNCNITSTIAFAKSENNKIFTDSEEFVFYTRLYGNIQKGLFFWGMTPIVFVPLVYIPWFHTNDFNTKNQITFVTTILNKNDKNLELTEKNIYLLNKKTNEKILPVKFEIFRTGISANSTHRPSSNVYCEKHIFYENKLQDSISFGIIFDKPDNYKDLKNYSFVIENNDKILTIIEIEYSHLTFYYNYAYGP
jgi:hypothetical protein